MRSSIELTLSDKNKNLMHAQKEVKVNRGRRPTENEHVKAMKTLILQLRFK